jgi:hypothetical protein
MAKKIGLPIRKLSENTSFYLVVVQTKTRKLLLTAPKPHSTNDCNIFFSISKNQK